MAQKTQKPLIVGVFHGTPEEMGAEAYAREYGRISEIIDAQPSNAKIGFETTKLQVDYLKRHIKKMNLKKNWKLLFVSGESPNVLTFALLNALSEKREIVALDTIVKHGQLRASKGRLKSWQWYKYSVLRSEKMAEKIREEMPAVSFVGDAHARDLNKACPDEFIFNFSPEYKGRRFGYRLARGWLRRILKRNLKKHKIRHEVAGFRLRHGM